MAKAKRVVLADQSDLFLNGLQAELSRSQIIDIVSVKKDFDSLIHYLKQADVNTPIDYIFLGDLWYLPEASDEQHGLVSKGSPRYLLDSVQEIALFCRQRGIKIVMFGLVDSWVIYQLLTQYRLIVGYLHKTDHLSEAIKDLLQVITLDTNTYYLSPTAEKLYFRMLHLVNIDLGFSWRDQVLLESVASGVSIQTTCRLLDISERTYHRSIASIRKKLKAKTNAHMVAQAFKVGLLRFGDAGEPNE